MAIGAGIAFYFLYRKPAMKSLLSHKAIDELLAWLGLGLIAYAVLVFDENTPFPSLYALVPTIGTALIIIFSSKETFSGKFLGSRALVGIGLISYSAYLWHQPLFVFARHRSLHEPSPLLFAVLSLLSLLLAFISWKYVEAPFRKRGVFSRNQIFSFTAIGSAIFIGFGLLGYLSKGFPERYPVELRNIASLSLSKVNAERNYLKKILCKSKVHSTICGQLSDQSPNVLIIGDSHGPDGLNIFSKAFPTANYLLAEQGGCPLLKNLTGITYAFKECNDFNKNRYEAIKEISKKIDVVVLSQRMSIPRLEETKVLINWLHKLDLPLVVLGAGPIYKTNLSTLILKLDNLEDIDSKLEEVAIKSQYKVDNELQTLVAELGGSYIIKQDILCPDGKCKILLSDGYPLLFDQHHLTLSAANLLGASIRKSSPSLLDGH